MMISSSALMVPLTGASLVLLLVFLRLFAIHPSRRSPPLPRAAELPNRLVIVLGSGGHTAELLNMLQNLPTSRYSHRTYVVSSGDDFSAKRAVAFEETLAGLASLRRKPHGTYDISIVPRARRIHQSLLTTPFSVIRCFLACVRLLATAPEKYLKQLESLEREVRSTNLRAKRGVPSGKAAKARYSPFPGLIVTNGPATGLVVVAASLWLRFFGFAPTGENGLRTIFVESWARVSSLSLSGKILVNFGMCERVLVQWEALQERYKKPLVGSQVEYIGPLVK